MGKAATAALGMRMIDDEASELARSMLDEGAEGVLTCTVRCALVHSSSGNAGGRRRAQRRLAARAGALSSCSGERRTQRRSGPSYGGW
eukprot:3372726-Prymnesium_polylepis.2